MNNFILSLFDLSSSILNRALRVFDFLTNHKSLIATLDELAIEIQVNELVRLLFEALHDFCCINSDIVVGAIENLSVVHDLVEICVELSARAVVLVYEPSEHQVEPHLLSDDASIIFRNLFLHTFFKVDKVVLVLVHKLLQVLSNPSMFVFTESRVRTGDITVEENLPEVDANDFI